MLRLLVRICVIKYELSYGTNRVKSSYKVDATTPVYGAYFDAMISTILKQVTISLIYMVETSSQYKALF